MTQIRIIDNCFNPTQIGSQQDQHAARILFLMFFHHTYTRQVVAKQYLRESAIIPAAPSRYLRRDTLVDLCCNSWPLSQEIGRSRGICFRRSRTYHDDCFSKSLYSPRARFIVTLLLLLLLAVRFIIIRIPSTIRPWDSRTDSFVTSRNVGFPLDIPSLFLSLCFFLCSCICRIESRLHGNCSYCCPSSFFRPNASLFNRKTNFLYPSLYSSLVFLLRANSGFLRPSFRARFIKW